MYFRNRFDYSSPSANVNQRQSASKKNVREDSEVLNPSFFDLNISKDYRLFHIVINYLI